MLFYFGSLAIFILMLYFYLLVCYTVIKSIRKDYTLAIIYYCFTITVIKLYSIITSLLGTL